MAHSNKPFGVTPKQHEAFKVIKELIEKNGYSPSYEDIAKELETTVTNVGRYVSLLKKRGLLDYKTGSRRSITIL